MPRRRQNRHRTRSTDLEQRKRQILVVTEGTVTERSYLESLDAHFRNPDISLKIKGVGGAPRTVVEEAVKLKKVLDETAGDQLWVVLDVDDHAHLNNSIRMAHDNGIRVALSNPCFELWLLLHFRDGPGIRNCDQIASLLREHVPKYKKVLSFSQCQPGYQEAVVRAQRLGEAIVDGKAGDNPTTAVHLLTKELHPE